MNINLIIPLLATLAGVSGEIVTLGSCNFVVSPEPCNTTYLQFFLFTRSMPEGEIVVFDENSDNLTSAAFNSSLENKIIIHGFNADMNLFALQNIKNEYLKLGDYNVWMINWPQLVAGPAYCYPAAVNNVAHAGHCLANAVRRLKIASDELLLHVIGFSLGAHVPGAAAEIIRPYLIPRITGLDPAMPGFVLLERRERLSKDSGVFVDIIHTNGLIQGLIEPLGHVDFYMNGGITQPGCFQDTISNWLNCDHVRAPEYFAESINSSNGFWGWKCNDLFYLLGLCNKQGKTPTLAGEHVKTSSRGTFAVVTNSEAPYARGKW